MKILSLIIATASISSSLLHAADPADVQIVRNVAYLPEGRKEKCDLYLPKELPKDKRLPAVLIIHGGGFVGGKRDASRELNIGSNLVRAGYVCMSIDYLLASDTQISWPQNLHDCKTAVRWLRANAEKYSIDTEHIGVIGGSAGGTLSALVTLTGPDAGLDPKEPYGNLSCQVQCGIDLYGPADLMSWMKTAKMFGKSKEEVPELYKQASPVVQATKGDPPLMIMHGTADTTVDISESKKMAEACEKAGIEHELVIVPGAPHTFDMQPKQMDLRPKMIGFFDKHLKR